MIDVERLSTTPLVVTILLTTVRTCITSGAKYSSCEYTDTWSCPASMVVSSACNTTHLYVLSATATFLSNATT